MELFQVIILALLQGLTEFLPISSSAHLILPKELLGWPDQGLAFDVAVHFGSLIAVLLYFRKDIKTLWFAWWASVLRREHSVDSRLGWYVIAATIPVGLVGFLLDDWIENNLRSVAVIAATTILFGLLLGYADRTGWRTKLMERMQLHDAVLIGLAQILALIPGTSRSGITITAGLMLGFERDVAARFSFLLSIPLILVSAAYKALELSQSSGVPWGDIALGTVLSGISAYTCIALFLRLINRIGMMPFVLYRLALGTFLVAFIVF